MTIKNKITLIALTLAGTLTAQETTQDTIIKQEIKLSYLDSIKKTFIKDDMATCVDERWMKELASLDLFDEMTKDIATVDLNQKVDFELPTELLKERLKKLDEKSPFNIEYNEGLENLIKNYLKNRRKSFERLMGISQYYFPMFEEAMARYDVPLEIKYLAVVESALKPKAVSSAKATGLWQFMFETGRQYGLKINTYVDERSNDLKASDAAARYMKSSYDALGDWELVLASYNSGLGNVTKAIRRSGGHQNFWNIKKYLPRETQSYVPAFLATMYIFEYHKEHGIVPDKAIAHHFATDTVAVKHHLTFKQVSDLLDMPVAEIEYFNPCFKRNEIPYFTGEIPYFIRLPKNKIATFVSNEDKIYAYANHQESLREKPFAKLPTTRYANKPKDSLNLNTNNDLATRFHYYKVRKGDNLSQIAEKYDVSVADIREWNNLRNNTAPKGRNLKIKTANDFVAKEIKVKDTIQNKKEVEQTITIAKTDKPEHIFKTEKEVSYKDVTKYYRVKKGDNLSSIASKHGVLASKIKEWNDLKSNNVMLGDNLKIIKNEKVVATIKKEIKSNTIEDLQPIAKVEKRKKEPKTIETPTNENYYVVVKGDNLNTISKKYNVSKHDLKRWNNLLDNNLKVGQQIAVLGDTETTETNPKTETVEQEYIVKKGDNIGNIAQKYHTTINNIKDWNNIKDNTVNLGQSLIVSKSKASKKDKFLAQNTSEKAKLYEVKKGDTLFKISQKFPGVTIADIKKWNNIKSENLQPGMKLKING